MTQWRDDGHSHAGTIEELDPVARPARVGSSRSARIPALIVAALLVGVVAAGVSGRTERPSTPVPPMAATDASPAPPPTNSPTPPGVEPLSPPERAPATPKPGPAYLPVEPWLPELRFWLVVLSDGQRQARLELESTDGFYGTVSIGEAWGDDVRTRLFGKVGTNEAVRLADVRVPRVPDGSLDLPLELGSGLVDAVTLGSGDRRSGRTPSVLRYQIRLEQGHGGPGPGRLVAEVLTAYTTTYGESSSPGEARDRALASYEVQEALTHSSRCSRMLDPRTGRSEANLDGCLRFLAREGVTWAVTPGSAAPTAPEAPSTPTSAPAAPDGATYWLDLRLDGDSIALEALDEAADGSYEAYFPYAESWYVKAPVLGLYGHSIIDGRPVSMATVQLTKGPRGQPGTPVELASAPSPRNEDQGGSPFWSVTLTRGQPHGLAILVQVRPRITR